VSFRPPAGDVSGVPLASVAAVVLDTETTGLDTRRDRVIEIAAVRLPGAATPDADTFASLVRPDVPIPEASTRIHRIADADVAGAPAFPDAMARFADWTGPALVLGYSVGFDLAVLEAEHARAGLAWTPPHSLDIAHLVRLAAPELPEQSLDLAAGWLGIAVADRHRALADARLAARVFEALLPRLRERGIATVAQAERACRGLTRRLDDEARIGWHAPGRPEDGGTSGDVDGPLARIDSFPYRHRVRDLMHAPPAVVGGGIRLSEALAAMVRDRISSLFVAPDDAPDHDHALVHDHGPRHDHAPGRAHAIVTERDVMRAIAADGAPALDRPVRTVAQGPLVTVEADEFVYRALTRMSGRGFRHLGVVDADGRLVGALSARDLLRQRAGDAVALGEAIEAAESVEALGRVWAGLTAVARALVAEAVDPRDIAAIVSRELQALTRRATELAEAELQADGAGTAPAPFAVLVLGSGGRGESLLAMDQDNAIVHADPPPGAGAAAKEHAAAWFARLGGRLSEILDTVGVAYCKGGVMAARPQWRGSAADWRATVGAWITRSRPEDILNADIFFDAAPVCGDAALARDLLDDARAAAPGSGNFLKLLALNAADFRVPVGWFGRFRGEDGRVDLKAGGLMPIFGAARVAALRLGSAARATPERLRAAREAGLVAAATAGNLDAAHRILLDLILRQQLADIERGVALSNRVDTGALSALQRKELRWALERVPSVADLLGVPLIR
jgi:CBS domain-containing protein